MAGPNLTTCSSQDSVPLARRAPRLPAQARSLEYTIASASGYMSGYPPTRILVDDADNEMSRWTVAAGPGTGTTFCQDTTPGLTIPFSFTQSQVNDEKWESKQTKSSSTTSSSLNYLRKRCGITDEPKLNACQEITTSSRYITLRLERPAVVCILI
jgi:hypothetical protein